MPVLTRTCHQQINSQQGRAYSTSHLPPMPPPSLANPRRRRQNNTAAKRKRVEDAAATDEPSYNLPLLAFHRCKQDMFVLSVADQILHKNPDRFSHLSPATTLYWSTPQGWMLIMEPPQPHAPSAAYLWNPSTGDELPLPNVPENHGLSVLWRCLLSHKDPSAHPGCVVVLLCSGESAMWYCHVTAAGGRWRRCAYEITDNFGLPPAARIGISAVASCRGKLYFIKSSGGSMGVIDFPSTPADNNGDRLHPVFQDFDVPGIKFPHGMNSGNFRLVESHDQLFLVYTFFGGDGDVGSVHAYRMDFSARAWRRVRDIGDAVVFLESYSYLAASCAASCLGLKPNQILYFINNHYFRDGSAHLLTFDLGLDILHNTWVPCHDTIHFHTPFWIVPPSS